MGSLNLPSIPTSVLIDITDKRSAAEVVRLAGWHVTAVHGRISFWVQYLVSAGALLLCLRHKVPRNKWVCGSLATAV